MLDVALLYFGTNVASEAQEDIIAKQKEMIRYLKEQRKNMSKQILELNERLSQVREVSDIQQSSESGIWVLPYTGDVLVIEYRLQRLATAIGQAATLHYKLANSL